MAYETEQSDLSAPGMKESQGGMVGKKVKGARMWKIQKGETQLQVTEVKSVSYLKGMYQR